MTLNLIDEIVKILLQLVVLGIIGGAVAWFFSQLQNKKELRLSTLREFSKLHGDFIALRYEFNSFYIQWEGEHVSEFHPLTEEEQRVERWKYYQESCHLLGEFQSLKPIVVDVFPKQKKTLTIYLPNIRIGVEEPVLENRFFKR